MEEENRSLIGDFAGEATGPETESEQGEMPGGQGKKHGFSSKIGFVLAAAGSAVGLGNLWRFPYLAAKHGGSLFVLVYLALAVTFGFGLLIMEIAIGRHTGKGVVGAFAALNKKWKWFGFVCVAIPIIIVPYYSVIGGWVMKYLVSSLVGSEGLIGAGADTGAFFGAFVSNTWQPLLFFFLFAAATIAVVIFGVQKGIERVSKILMPILAVMVVFLAIYAMCQPGAIEGVKKLFIPDVSGMQVNDVFMLIVDAMGQLFYSLSLAMAIMITYGSYMKKSASIRKSSVQICIADSLFAVFAAMIIIPSIFAGAATHAEAVEAMGKSGPSLMFVVLPKMFNGMAGGRIVAVIFFILVLFAALTSSISLVESIVAVLCDNNRMKRWVACLIIFGTMLVLGTLSSLGFGPLSMVTPLGPGSSFLDLFDFVSNTVLMPIVAIGTCILVGFFTKTDTLLDEIGMRSKRYRYGYVIAVRYVAPVLLGVILVTGILFMFI